MTDSHTAADYGPLFTPRNVVRTAIAGVRLADRYQIGQGKRPTSVTRASLRSYLDAIAELTNYQPGQRYTGWTMCGQKRIAIQVGVYLPPMTDADGQPVNDDGRPFSDADYEADERRIANACRIVRKHLRVLEGLGLIFVWRAQPVNHLRINVDACRELLVSDPWVDPKAAVPAVLARLESAGATGPTDPVGAPNQPEQPDREHGATGPKTPSNRTENTEQPDRKHRATGPTDPTSLIPLLPLSPPSPVDAWTDVRRELAQCGVQAIREVVGALVEHQVSPATAHEAIAAFRDRPWLASQPVKLYLRLVNAQPGQGQHDDRLWPDPPPSENARRQAAAEVNARAARVAAQQQADAQAAAEQAELEARHGPALDAMTPRQWLDLLTAISPALAKHQRRHGNDTLTPTARAALLRELAIAAESQLDPREQESP